MAKILDLFLDQGSTLIQKINYQNSNKANLSLTGYSARAKMRRSYYTSNAIIINATITDPGNGELTLSLPANVTSGIKAGRWVYDAEVYTDGETSVIRVIEGTITVMPGVTGLPVTSANVYVITTDDLSEGTNLFFTNARAQAAVSVSISGLVEQSIANITTANISELDNLYFTNARAVAALSAGNRIILDANGRISANVSDVQINNLDDILDVVISMPLTEEVLMYNGNAWVNSTISSNPAQINNLIWANVTSGNVTTSYVTEGANLYFTNARVWANIQPHISNLDSSIANLTSNIDNRFAALTTSNIAEGSNLYFTNDRVWANVTSGSLSTDYIIEASNLYFTNDRVWANVTSHLANKADNIYVNNLSTTNIREGANLYFSAQRVYSTIGTENSQYLYFYEDNGRFDIVVTEFVTGINGLKGDVILTTANVTETTGNEYYSNDRVWANVGAYISNFENNFTNLSTSNIAEGANLWFTAQRVRSNISGGVGVEYDSENGVINIGQNISPHAPQITFSNVTITGNLFVIGNTTTVSTQTLTSTDPSFVVGNTNPSDSLDLGYHGFYNDGTGRYTGIFRDASDGLWKLYTNLTVEPDNTVNTNPASGFHLANLQLDHVHGRVTSIDNFTTSNLIEGANLYFSNDRVWANIAPRLNTGNVTETTNLYFSNDRVWANIAPRLNTANISESSGNLYFTNTRARTAISVVGSGSYDNTTGIITVTGGVTSVNDYTGAVLLDTDDIIETASNLYYTDERVRAALYFDGTGVEYDEETGFVTIDAGVISVNGANGEIYLSTDEIDEGSNLYFTNTRAREAISIAGSGSYDVETGIITITGGVETVNGANGTVVLTTANIAETGANLYFSNDRVWANVGSKIESKAELTTVQNLTTTSIREGANLYYTNARVWANVSSWFDTKADNAYVDSKISELTTSNITEGLNLYFTNTRARNAFTAGTGVQIQSNGEISVSAAVTSVNGEVGAVSLNTDDIEEGETNQYFTTGRALAAVIGNFNTDDVAEGANLYFTNARVWANVSANIQALETFRTTVSTSNVSEGANLYFTNARAVTAVTVATLTNLTLSGTLTASNVSANVDGLSIGYKIVPQNYITDSVTLSNVFSGRHGYSNSASLITLTMPNDSQDNMPIGTTMAFVNNGTANVLFLQGSGVSLWLAQAPASGTRILISRGMASFVKVAANLWYCSGSGLL